MNQLDRIGTFCEKCNNVVCRCKTTFKCMFCKRPMEVSLLGYKSNQYCNHCFNERADSTQKQNLNTFEFMGDKIDLCELHKWNFFSENKYPLNDWDIVVFSNKKHKYYIEYTDSEFAERCINRNYIKWMKL